jgi:hypothetical protein
MPRYEVKVVRPEYLANWYEAWGKSKMSPKTEKLLNAGELGRNTIVEAKNKNEAELKAKQLFDGHIVISEDTREI